MKEKTKIIILTVTYHNVHNCGAMLQAYALQQVLIKLGYKNYLINYGKKQNIFDKFSIRQLQDHSIVEIVYFPLRNIKSFLIYLRTNVRILEHYSEWKGSWNKFQNFNDTYLLKTRLYKTMSDLEQNPPKADICLVGSDQMWLFRKAHELMDYYMLNFSNYERYRTYAVSMGGFYDLQGDALLKFKKGIHKFSNISGRESNMEKYIKGIGYKGNIYTHIDPTFLVKKEQWSELADKADGKVKYLCRRKYTLVFELLSSGDLHHFAEERENNQPVILFSRCPNTKLKIGQVIRNAGPLEFLWMIKNAEYIATNSFHAIVFSIIFQKPFTAFLSSNAPERIISLLSNLKLSKQIYKGGDSVFHVPDFTYAKQYIDKERKAAMDYLSGLYGS